MRKIILLLLIITAFTTACQKKNPYKIVKPESVIWNPVTKTYLISNAGSGIILSLMDKYEFSVFNKFKLISPKGMAIHNNTLYVADVYRVIGLNLKTGKKTFLIKFSKDSFLNDIAVSSDGMVYVSDTKNNLIRIINPDTDETDVFTHKDISNPNGLYYVKQDGAELLYISSFRPDAQLQVLNLKTKELTSLPETQIHFADGIARKPDGSWLISSWADSTIYSFSPDFTVRTQIFDKYPSPADISFSTENNELAIPHFETNKISFITQVDSTQIDSLKSEPSPFNKKIQ